jgi:hypothetical protein
MAWSCLQLCENKPNTRETGTTHAFSRMAVHDGFAPFVLFCFQDWHGRAKVPGCYFDVFSDLKAHGLLAM